MSKRDRPSKQRPPAPETVQSDWRLFLAVPLPAAVVELVSGLIDELAAEEWPVRWVAPGNAHLTLHFLGETPPERAELLRLALGSVVARHAPFRLRTADLGVFPNQRRPRVLWLGLHGPAHRLAALHADLGATLRAYDFPAEDSTGFHPHITLGRVRDPVPRMLPGAIQRRFAEISAAGIVSAAVPRPVPIDEVVLVRSYLGKGPPRYEAVGCYPLGERARSVTNG